MRYFHLTFNDAITAQQLVASAISTNSPGLSVQERKGGSMKKDAWGLEPDEDFAQTINNLADAFEHLEAQRRRDQTVALGDDKSVVLGDEISQAIAEQAIRQQQRRTRSE